MSQIEIETEALTPDQLDAIIRALEGGTKQLPVAAIQAARRHRAQVVPELIKLMRQATETLRRQEKYDKNGAFFALFLLAEFQAAEGLPAILEAISLPGDGPFELFGDAIHDVLPRVLVSLAKEQCKETCAALFRNAQLNEYVRWSSAKAIVYLAMAGLRPREEIVHTCKELLGEVIAQEDAEAVSALVISMLELNPWEAAKEIEDAYQRQLVDSELIDWESVQEHLHDKPIEPSHEYPTPVLIEDTIAELETWASFRPQEARRPASLSPSASPSVRTPVPTPRPLPLSPPLAPPTSRPRVGRNDPCPCGSGKKFKKCCGGRR